MSDYHSDISTLANTVILEANGIAKKAATELNTHLHKRICGLESQLHTQRLELTSEINTLKSREADYNRRIENLMEENQELRKLLYNKPE